MIKILYLLSLGLIISLILLSLEYSPQRFANGQMQKESSIIVYDDNNSEHYSVLDDPNNTLLKPKVDVSIEGTPNNDQIKGGDGDDQIDGNDGSDQLRGQEGNDKIDGNEGNDILYGEDGNDQIKEGDGNDRISGGIGNDKIEGEKGNDKLFGGEGHNLLDGGEGNDVILGGRGIDMMIGGRGTDTFICDQFDILIDFNRYEGDQIIGSCSVEYLVEEEEEIHEDNNNIFPLETEAEFERLSPSLLSPQSPNSSSSLPPLNSFEMPSLSKDLQRIPLPPTPSSNF